MTECGFGRVVNYLLIGESKKKKRRVAEDSTVPVERAEGRSSSISSLHTSGTPLDDARSLGAAPGHFESNGLSSLSHVKFRPTQSEAYMTGERRLIGSGKE